MENKIAIIGLGYVGLPLAIEFAKYFPTIGFDINPERINQLKFAKDNTNEISPDVLKSVLIEENPIKNKDLILQSVSKSVFSSHQIKEN